MPDRDDPLTRSQTYALIEFAEGEYTLSSDMDDEELEQMLELLMVQLFGETIH